MSLGGSTTEAGLFLGFLTYASAISAPITGAIADRIGKRRVLIVASLAITVFSLLYAVAPSYQVILGARARARRVLVRAAIELELVRDRHPAQVAPRRRHGVFGIRQHPRRRGGAVDWIVAVRSWRLAAAVPRSRGPQHADGVPGLATAAGQAPRGPRALVASSGSRRMAHPDRRRHVVPLFVQLRRHHQLRRGLRRHGRRHAARPLFHGVLPDDCRDPAVHRPLRRSRRPRADDRAVPGD